MTNKSKNIIIKDVEPGSIAEELGISPGDALVSMNGRPVNDVFDFRFFQAEEFLEILIAQPDGTEVLYEVEKDEDEDLGFVFEDGLLDAAKRCANKCVFCFIDQLPSGMRETLYFKDDDARLSFLQGNYVTLTNITDQDLDRIIFYRLSPINISVHAADPELRALLLGSPKAKRFKKHLDKLYAAGIAMNFQVVLMKGLNDGEKLDETIEALSRYAPVGHSLSVVPVGLTGHRDKLFPLEPFTTDDCSAIIRQLNGWQKRLKAKIGTSFVYAADEFYLKAGGPVPAYAHYEDFPQIENGVGMLASFRREFETALNRTKKDGISGNASIITGKAAYPFMCELLEKAVERFPLLNCRAIEVKNDFFGENITVSGLLTGQDILKQALKTKLGDVLFVPQNALRAQTDVFLDDVTVSELSRKLGVAVKAVPVGGRAFLKALLSM